MTQGTDQTNALLATSLECMEWSRIYDIFLHIKVQSIPFARSTRGEDVCGWDQAEANKSLAFGIRDSVHMDKRPRRPNGP